jgi:TM2 domain-containing membrane protein YozV
MKDKTTAAILALLLGGIGIHKFYLGKGALGLLYLLFCWTLIPALVGFIEGILLLLMSKKDFDLDYNPLSVGEFRQLAIAQATSMSQSVASLSQLHAKPTMSRIETLQALQNLRATGALSEEEFEREKKMLLASSRA